MSRKVARELLFKLVFEAELKEVKSESLINSFVEREKENIIEKFEANREALKKEFQDTEELGHQVVALNAKLEERLNGFETSLIFLKEYSSGIDKYNAEILEEISTKMEGWTYERIGNVEKVLLKTAIYELLYQDTPKEVVLNEHIELAKKYGDIKSYEFINGVLAKFV